MTLIPRFIDGASYFEAVASSLEEAEEEILIAGWWWVIIGKVTGIVNLLIKIDLAGMWPVCCQSLVDKKVGEVVGEVFSMWLVRTDEARTQGHTHLFLCSFVCLFVCLTIYFRLFFHLFVWLSEIFICLCVCVIICWFVWLFLCLFVCLFVCCIGSALSCTCAAQ